MSEFVGRTGSKRAYSYPENTRAAAASIFARNLAIFTPGDTPHAIPASPGQQIPWNFIASGGIGADVPITPKSTGELRITGFITVVNTGAAQSVTVQVEVDGTPINTALDGIATIAAGASAVVPIFAETLFTPVGTTSQIEVRLTGSDTDLQLVNAELDVQEVGGITG